MSQTEIEKLFSQLDKIILDFKKLNDISYLDALIEVGADLVSFMVDDHHLMAEKQQQFSDMQASNINQMSKEDLRKVYQLVLLRGMKIDNLQQNHQLTPDAIGFVLVFLLEVFLTKNELAEKQITILDIAVGTGNLLATLCNSLLQKEMDVKAYGVDVDDLLLSLAAVGADIEKQNIQLFHQDGLQGLLIPPVDFAVSDLPVGYYPNDETASKFVTHTEKGHTYAHHLLIEQSMYYVKESGFGLFLVPSNFFETEQAGNFTKWLSEAGYLQVALQLPKTLFKQTKVQKTIIVIQNKGDAASQVKEVLLGEIPDFKNMANMQKFIAQVNVWYSENLLEN